jgi:hypothetical protein
MNAKPAGPMDKTPENAYNMSLQLKNGSNSNSRFMNPRRICYGLVALCLFLSGKAFAMDRFTALSQVESGDNDFAIGRAGEISRYQIRRELWQHATATPLSQATNSTVAFSVARTIAKIRSENFQQTYHRPPTDIEFYILWNAPGEIDHPSNRVRSRATLYANLVQAAD